MAGLGESRSHVASLLWAVEAGVKLRESMTVTQKKAYWGLPPCIKDILYALLIDIKFEGKSAMLNAWKVFRTISPAVDRSPSPTPSSASRIHLVLHHLYHLAQRKLSFPLQKCWMTSIYLNQNVKINHLSFL